MGPRVWQSSDLYMGSVMADGQLATLPDSANHLSSKVSRHAPSTLEFRFTREGSDENFRVP